MFKSRLFRAATAGPLFAGMLLLILVAPLVVQGPLLPQPPQFIADLSMTPRAGGSFHIRSGSTAEALGVRFDTASHYHIRIETFTDEHLAQVQLAPRLAPSFSYRLLYLIPKFNSSYKDA